MRRRVAVVGGSGYTGGELIRLLLGHPGVELVAVSSRQYLGKPLHAAHPNLRGFGDLSFVVPEEIGPSDVIFLCMPHGQAAGQIDRWRSLAPLIIDLSADFRLRDPGAYRAWYGSAHPRPDLLGGAVYGLAELSREELGSASLISGVGCNATAMNLALGPLASAGLIDRVIADIKVGSSEAGKEPNPGSHHPERSGATRTYAPAGHRHAAEVHQALGSFTLDVTITAVELVRGVLCTAHVIPSRPVEKKELWRLYRAAYGHEPFVRIVSDAQGLHRLPDPKALLGSNFADVGFEVDPATGRVVALCALDNLMKGAAGSAVQAMNIALGIEEKTGLWAPGIYPA